MIASLRRRHRTWITVLLLLTACVFTWAIAARKPVPMVAAPPGAAAAPP